MDQIDLSSMDTDQLIGLVTRLQVENTDLVGKIEKYEDALADQSRRLSTLESEEKPSKEKADSKKKAEGEEEAAKKAEEEAETKKKAEEEAEAKKKAEVEAEAQKKAEEEAETQKKAEEEAEAAKKAEEETEATKKAEEEAEAKKKAEEEAEAAKKAEEEAKAKKKAEEEAEAKKKAEEEAEVQKKAEEEAEAKKKAEEEAEVQKKAEEEAEAKKKAEEEAEVQKKAEEEAEAKKKAEEEAETAKKAEEEAETKKKAEEEAKVQKKAEEEAEAAKKAEEEAEATKKAEEAETKKKAEEQAEADKKAEEEAEAQKKAEEEAEVKKRAEEEAEAKKKAEEEAEASKKAEEEAKASKKAEEEAKAQKKAEEEKSKPAKEEEKDVPKGLEGVTMFGGRVSVRKKASNQAYNPMMADLEAQRKKEEEFQKDLEIKKMESENPELAEKNKELVKRKMSAVAASGYRRVGTAIEPSGVTKAFFDANQAETTTAKKIKWDEAFNNAGTEPGIEIWRIENLKPIPVPKKSHGSFYTGDSYIILHVSDRLPYVYSLHFWLGSESSQDEKGACAYKTVELDTKLGGAATQFRETQGHETQRFLSYFPAIQYLAGGIDGAFKHVDRDYHEDRLLHVKGRRNVRVTQLPMHTSSLNRGDVFILDCGKELFQWNGKDSSLFERSKGLEVTDRIRNEEQGGKSKVYVIDDGKDADFKFFEKLEGTPEEIKSTEDGGDDEIFERQLQASVKLYQVCDASGQLEVKEIGSRPLKHSLLDTNDCFILDMGGTGIFIWIGKKSTEQEKEQALTHASDFAKDKGYPDWIPITRVVEKGETPMFKMQFGTWPKQNKKEDEAVYIDGVRIERNSSIAQPTEKKAFDVSKLHSGSDDGFGSFRMKRNRSQQKLSEGASNGRIKSYVVEKDSSGEFKAVEMPETEKSQLYSGSSYIIVYTYNKEFSGRDHHILYNWQGSKSAKNKSGASALLTQSMLGNEFNGQGVQARVVSGKEPEHFFSIFKGKFVVRDKENDNDSGIRLFHVRGTSDFNTHAIQVKTDAVCLNSNDVFVVKNCNNNNGFIWYGKGSSENEKKVGKEVCSTLIGQDAIEVMEGEEEASFWEALGGKKEYATSEELQDVNYGFRPRLFQCSNATGSFNVEEIYDFSQSDLISDDVMLLDAYREVFIWIGDGANEEETRESRLIAENYIDSCPDGRSKDTVIYITHQGFEPINFTCYFHAWNEKYWSNYEDYEKMKAKMTESQLSGRTSMKHKRETAKKPSAGSVLEPMGESEDKKEEKEDLSALKKYPIKRLQDIIVPPGVDKLHKEKHLTDEDFQTLFGMNRDKFNALPEWKKTNLKKSKKMF